MKMIRYLKILLMGSLFLVSCGPELFIVFLPAISATWCVEGEPCHKFEFRPDTTTNNAFSEGVVSGREFYINPSDGKNYKDPGYEAEGDNLIIGTFDNLNIAFTIHKRENGIEERPFVGAMEINDDQVTRMVLESLVDGGQLVLTREGGACDCQ
jgi:hypothetical protein